MNDILDSQGSECCTVTRCRWALLEHDVHKTSVGCFWMLPEARRNMRQYRQTCAPAAHLHDVNGDAALSRHAGGRPPELAVEVEDGREEQVIREDGRESLHASRHTVSEARCPRLPG